MFYGRDHIKKGYCQCIFFGKEQIKKRSYKCQYKRSKKDANNKTNDEETLVTNNSVINALIYFKLIECSKNS